MAIINRRRLLPMVDRRRRWLDRRSKLDDFIINGGFSPEKGIRKIFSRRKSDLFRDVSNIFKKY